jgi:hypothetical protein
MSLGLENISLDTVLSAAQFGRLVSADIDSRP